MICLKATFFSSFHLKFIISIKYELMTNKNVSIYFTFLGMMQEISTVIQLQWILKHTSWSNFSHDKCEKKCTYMHTISKPSSNFPELIIIQIHSRQVNWEQILKMFQHIRRLSGNTSTWKHPCQPQFILLQIYNTKTSHSQESSEVCSKAN